MKHKNRSIDYSTIIKREKGPAMNRITRLRTTSGMRRDERRAAWAGVLLVLLLALPAAAQDQFIYTTTNGTISIIKYTGPGGAVTIPSTIDGLPVTSIDGQFSSGFWVGAFESCSSLTSIAIGTNVTRIGNGAFRNCHGLTDPAIPNSVTSIGAYAFEMTSLVSVTIPNSVTHLGGDSFDHCPNLSSVKIGTGLAVIPTEAFWSCPNLTSIYIEGNAPSLGWDVFSGVSRTATVYYVAGTTGWGPTFGGLPTALWVEVPTILVPPRTQTAEVGSAVSLSVQASKALPLSYVWYLNATNLISSSTRGELELSNVQISDSGAYTVVVTNMAGAVTSAPAMLSVIAAVERRPVPGVKLMGQLGTSWDVVYANSLGPAPNWATLGSVSLSSTPQYYFDLTQALPPQRFYRAWQTTPPNQPPTLEFHMVPAVTLTGNIGNSVRVDAINRFGPIDAWVTVATVTLTNTSQLYFDVSAPGQPERHYRLVQVP
jgi:BspA type Leucine rich repeat region (6 copies)/Immunoglobulin domain